VIKTNGKKNSDTAKIIKPVPKQKDPFDSFDIAQFEM
jgi:hypothetical protein